MIWHRVIPAGIVIFLAGGAINYAIDGQCETGLTLAALVDLMAFVRRSDFTEYEKPAMWIACGVGSMFGLIYWNGGPIMVTDGSFWETSWNNCLFPLLQLLFYTV